MANTPLLHPDVRRSAPSRRPAAQPRPADAPRRGPELLPGFALGLVAALVAVAAGLSDLVILWWLLVLVVVIHEAGHALAASRLRLEPIEMVVGFGPVLARWSCFGVPAELRAVPLVGWVASELQPRIRGVHRREALFAAAGPAANLVSALAVVLLWTALSQGAVTIGARETASASALVLRMAADTPAMVVRSAMTFADVGSAPISAGDVGRGAGRSSVRADRSLHVASDGVPAHEPTNVLLRGAAMSASLAGFNLIPAPWFDGQGILEAVAGGVRIRHRRAGRAMRTAVRILGLVCAGLILVTFVPSVARELGLLG